MSKPIAQQKGGSLLPAFIHGLIDDLRLFFPEYEKDFEEDRECLLKRVSHEGNKVLFLLLPQLGKALENSLITRNRLVIPLGLPLRSHSKLPEMFHQLFKELFDIDGFPIETFEDREILRRASVLRSLRQALSSFSKVRTDSVLKTDEELVSSFSKRVTARSKITLPNYITRGAAALIRSVVMDGDRLAAPLYQWTVDPFGRHGPGAVAGKEDGVLKWDFAVAKGQCPLLYKWHDTSFLKRSSHVPTSRLTLVPKDFRGKRAICIEPKENQFAQQGLMKVLYDLIEGHHLAGQCIKFDDQTTNYWLSANNSMATIDLKDASDTIHMDLCRLLFPKEFFALITRYRSRIIRLPDGSEIRPTCFASMGSALCFPIETLVFWAIAQSTLDHYHRHGSLRVFGDDILCPNSGFDVVCQSLRQAGCIINQEKSCFKTPIRESCGSWFYYNYDCRFVKIYYQAVDDHDSWISVLETIRPLVENHHLNLARSLLREASRFYPVCWSFRRIFGDDPTIRFSPQRWNKDLQRYESQLPSITSDHGRSTVPDDAVLYAWLVGNDVRPTSFRRLRVKMGWTSPTLVSD